MNSPCSPPPPPPPRGTRTATARGVKSNLYGSIKMYKSRITAWGLDKKLKGDEILAVLRARAQREAEGKRTEFWTARGSKLDTADIERYLQRNPSMLIRFHSGAEPSPEAARRIICRTPPPPPCHPRAPLADEERTLRVISNYTLGSLEGHQWDWTFNGHCKSRRAGALDRLETFRSHAYLASECYYAGDRHHVIRFANMACALLRDILLDEHPKLISTLCRLISLIRHHTVPDFLTEVGKFAVNLSRILLGMEHPITQVLIYLFSNLSTHHIMDWAQRMFRLSWATFANVGGDDNYLLVHLFRDYRQTMICRPRFWDGVEQELVEWMDTHPRSNASRAWLSSQMHQRRAWNHVRDEEIGVAEESLDIAMGYIKRCRSAGCPVDDLLRVQDVIQAEVARNKEGKPIGLQYVEALKATLHVGDAEEGIFRSICEDLELQWRSNNKHKLADQLVPLRPKQYHHHHQQAFQELCYPSLRMAHEPVNHSMIRMPLTPPSLTLRLPETGVVIGEELESTTTTFATNVMSPPTSISTESVADQSY